MFNVSFFARFIFTCLFAGLSSLAQCIHTEQISISTIKILAENMAEKRVKENARDNMQRNECFNWIFFRAARKKTSKWAWNNHLVYLSHTGKQKITRPNMLFMEFFRAFPFELWKINDNFFYIHCTLHQRLSWEK